MNQDPTDLDTKIAVLELLDHDGVDWQRVQRTAYLIHQHLRYEYPAPIADLHQRLMIIPPTNYGDQQRVMHHLNVSASTVEVSEQHDDFGNVVLHLSIPRVEQAIDFEAWIVV